MRRRSFVLLNFHKVKKKERICKSECLCVFVCVGHVWFVLDRLWCGSPVSLQPHSELRCCASSEVFAFLAWTLDWGLFVSFCVCFGQKCDLLVAKTFSAFHLAKHSYRTHTVWVFLSLILDIFFQCLFSVLLNLLATHHNRFILKIQHCSNKNTFFLYKICTIEMPHKQVDYNHCYVDRVFFFFWSPVSRLC